MAKSEHQLLFFALIFAALFLSFYPKFWDVDYLSTIRTSYWFWEGKFVESNPQYAYYMTNTGKGFYAYPFEIGRMLVSAPFVLISWNAPFILGLLFHLLGTFFFYRLLKFSGFDARYALAYLFFPSLAVIAHKFMIGETASAALILAASYFYLRGKIHDNLTSGVIFGLSVWFRVTNIAVLIGFLIPAFLTDRKKAWPLFAGMLLAATPFFLVTYLTIDTPWGYSYLAPEFQIEGGTKKDLSITQSATYFAEYIIFLLIGVHPIISRGFMFLFPLTLVGLFKAKYLKKEIFLSLALLMAIHALSGITPDGRYLVPLMPLMLFLIVAPADSAIELIGKRIGFVTRERVIYAILLLFILITGAALFLQSERTMAKYKVSQGIYSSTHEGALLVDTEGGHTVSFLLEKFGDRKSESMSKEKLLEKVTDSCWVKENGGIGNIYYTRIWLYPRKEFSARAFMKTDIVDFQVTPLKEFLAENGITEEMVACK